MTCVPKKVANVRCTASHRYASAVSGASCPCCTNWFSDDERWTFESGASEASYRKVTRVPRLKVRGRPRKTAASSEVPIPVPLPT